MKNFKIQQNEKNISQSTIVTIFVGLLVGGFLIRIYFTPFQIPISLDGIDYFAYAVAMSREGTFPNGYLLTNFGWSSFVSIFFTFFQNSEMQTLMNIQRILSISISIVTAIPIYYLSKIFFKKEIAFLSTTLFLFDPRIIENSILGITETLFIFLVVLTILFIFYKKSSFIWLSFVCAALAAFVRYEGLLLIVPVIISFCIKNYEIKYSKMKFGVGIMLFLAIIIPVNFIDYENSQKFSIFTQFIERSDYVSEHVIYDKVDNEIEQEEENKIQNFIINAIKGFFSYLGWILIPIFILFVVLGVIFMPKTISKNKIIFGTFFIFLIIPSIFAYGREIQDTRYLLVLLPIFSVFSCYGLIFLKKFNFKQIFILTIISIIVVSFIFTDYKKINSDYENEIYQATLFLTERATGINNYEHSKYFKVAELQNNWPELLPQGEKRKIIYETAKIRIEEYKDPLEFIKSNKNNNLSHLMIIKENDNGFFDDIFMNEVNYPYLEKIYDSNKIVEYKIFEINYDKVK